MFERIVVPLDGSRLSAQAIPYANELAHKFNSQVMLLRVVTDNHTTYATQTGGFGENSVMQIISEQIPLRDVENTAHARRYLMNRAKDVSDDGVTVTYHVTEGSPARSIMEFAELQQASLIVMMSHGRGRFKRAILGSVTDAIMRGSSVPVMVIRAQGMPD
jgi:nucleotide-binding universal stress UspA family protein